MFRLTLKNLLARKFRLVTTGIAVVLGVAFIVGTLVLSDTISHTFDSLFSNVFKGIDAQVRAKEPFSTNEPGAGSTRPRIDASWVAKVGKVEGVRNAEGDVSGYAQLIGRDGKAIGKPGQGAPTFGGVWSHDPDLNAFDLAEGRAPLADDEVVIDRGSAKKGHLGVGDRTHALTKVGVIPVHIVGIATFGSTDSPAGASYIGFTLSAAQHAIGEPGKFDSVSVVADSGTSQTELKTRLARILPKDMEAITGAELTKENQNDAQQFIGVFRTFMLAFALIALFVGSFIIYNTFSILVAQRIREMALLRALGASRRQVRRSLLAEALVVGALASVLGVLVGVGVAAGLKALLAAFGLDIPATGLVLTPGTVVFSLAAGTIVSVLAAWLPARRGAKVPPIAAMRDVALDHTGRAWVRIVVGGGLGAIGVALLFSGLFGKGDNAIKLVGLGAFLTLIAVTALGALVARPISSVLGRPVAAWRGVPGGLARENAMRNPRRTSTTASALMIGVTLVAFITIFASSAKASVTAIFDQQFTGDFVLDTNTFGFGGVSPTMANELRQRPEIEAVSSYRVTQVRFAGAGRQLLALDAKEIGKIADLGVEQGSLEDLDATSIAVLDDKAKEEGWHIGTRVPVQFSATGVQELTLRVIYKNKDLANRYWVDTSVFDANVRDQGDSVVFAKVAPGVSIAQARPAVEKIARVYPNVKVQDRDEFIASQSKQINQMLALIYVLLALAIVIAFFGIMNTLALSIVERTRELGLLRAVGMTRRQLKSMIRWEAILIALFGTVGGLGVGSFFGWSFIKALNDQGFHVFNVPVTQLMVIAVLASLFGVLAAVLPARRAAKLDVLTAIAAE